MEDVVSIYKVNFGPTAATLPLFINPNKTKGFTNKEELYTVIYSIYMKTWEPSSHGLNISPMNYEHEIYTICGNLA